MGVEVPDIVDALVSCKRINLDLRNKQGFSVFHMAVFVGNLRYDRVGLNGCQSLKKLLFSFLQGGQVSLEEELLMGQRTGDRYAVHSPAPCLFEGKLSSNLHIEPFQVTKREIMTMM